jgi:hypothetical protein
MMGNVHAMAHRATAISVACLASTAFLLCLVAGMGCNFVKITAEPELSLMTPDGVELPQLSEAFFGVICSSPFYDEEDRMWSRSRIFLYISLVLGGITSLIAWTLGVYLPPTNKVWRVMSILGTGAAVLEVPIFLIFETEACNMDITRQSCQMATGAYLNIFSIIFFVILTLWTQLVPPPDWSEESEAWTRHSPNLEGREVKVGEISIPSADGSWDGTEEGTAPQGSPPRTKEEKEAPRSIQSYWRRAERKRKEQTYPIPEVSPDGPYDEIAGTRPVVDADEKATEQGSVCRTRSSETAEKPRSFFRSASLFFLGRRPRELEKPSRSQDPERSDAEVFEDIEVEAPVILNRQVSLLSAYGSSEQSSEVPVLEEEGHVADSHTRERVAIGFNMAGLCNRFVRSSGEDTHIMCEKPLRLTVICPDGTEETKRVRFNDGARADKLSIDRSHEPVLIAPQNSESRDIILTHSLARANTVPTSNSGQRALSSPPTLSRNSPPNTAVGPTPVEMFTVTHTMSCDDSVSEMTQGPLDVREDTLAILQDLRSLED